MMVQCGGSGITLNVKEQQDGDGSLSEQHFNVLHSGHLHQQHTLPASHSHVTQLTNKKPERSYTKVKVKERQRQIQHIITPVLLSLTVNIINTVLVNEHKGTLLSTIQYLHRYESALI